MSVRLSLLYLHSFPLVYSTLYTSPTTRVFVISYLYNLSAHSKLPTTGSQSFTNNYLTGHLWFVLVLLLDLLIDQKSVKDKTSTLVGLRKKRCVLNFRHISKVLPYLVRLYFTLISTALFFLFRNSRKLFSDSE